MNACDTCGFVSSCKKRNTDNCEVNDYHEDYDKYLSTDKDSWIDEIDYIYG